MQVATAKNKSTQFVVFRKNDLQSGNDIAKRTIISIANITVAIVSVMPALTLVSTAGVTKKSERSSTH